MSHDRGCFQCGDDPPYTGCKRADCPKRDDDKVSLAGPGARRFNNPAPPSHPELDRLIERARVALEDGDSSKAILEAGSRHPEFLAFVEAMASKLNANKDKLSKPKLPPAALLQLLRAELLELEVAMQFQTPEDIRSECADVANFAMLIFKRHL